MERGMRVVIRETSSVVKGLELQAGTVVDFDVGELNHPGEKPTKIKVKLDEPISLGISKIWTIWIKREDLMY